MRNSSSLQAAALELTEKWSFAIMIHCKKRSNTAVVGSIFAALSLAIFSQPSIAQATYANAPITKNSRGWSGSGEFGYAEAAGNSRSQSINARAGAAYESDQWLSRVSAGMLKSKGEVESEDGAGALDVERYVTTADRYDLAASSALKLSNQSYLVGTIRYDHDDFNTYMWQGTAGVGFGYRWYDNERVRLVTEIGPAFRRVHNVGRGIEDDTIGRGFVDFSYQLTPTTTLRDTLLVESGRLNTYVQNEVGLQVAMTEKLALKAGYQVRHNSDVEPGFHRTDTLTTLNLVYKVE